MGLNKIEKQYIIGLAERLEEKDETISLKIVTRTNTSVRYSRKKYNFFNRNIKSVPKQYIVKSKDIKLLYLPCRVIVNIGEEELEYDVHECKKIDAGYKIICIESIMITIELVINFD